MVMKTCLSPAMFGTTAAASFPPALWRRDREGGERQTLASVATPHTNPPPQGGREQAVHVGSLR
jgi:hypothetical protein